MHNAWIRSAFNGGLLSDVSLRLCLGLVLLENSVALKLFLCSISRAGTQYISQLTTLFVSQGSIELQTKARILLIPNLNLVTNVLKLKPPQITNIYTFQILPTRLECSPDLPSQARFPRANAQSYLYNSLLTNATGGTYTWRA